MKEILLPVKVTEAPRSVGYSQSGQIVYVTGSESSHPVGGVRTGLWTTEVSTRGSVRGRYWEPPLLTRGLEVPYV